jgi:hypothetical protein
MTCSLLLLHGLLLPKLPSRRRTTERDLIRIGRECRTRSRRREWLVGKKALRVEILVSGSRGKGKSKTAGEDSDEYGSDVELPIQPKGKKSGPKAWTALENEGK